MKIDEKTTLEEILKIEGIEKVLDRFKLPCLYCPMAATEMKYLKIRDICDFYGIDKEKLLTAVNAFLMKKRKPENMNEKQE